MWKGNREIEMPCRVGIGTAKLFPSHVLAVQNTHILPFCALILTLDSKTGVSQLFLLCIFPQ